MIAMASPARVARRPVHGVLLLNKPQGLSSNQALQKAKWLLRALKAGHTGTLDPMATGVLPLCFGSATKFAQLQLNADKRYKAVARLGIVTDTGDAQGQEVARHEVQVSQQQVNEILPQFMGEIMQTPPMYSALKHQGKALYEYARSGVEIERESRKVRVHAMTADLLDAQTLALDVTCSKGTYIRTLAEDMGKALGCGAHLIALDRVETGRYQLAECITLETLEAMSEQERLKCLQPSQTLLDEAPVVWLAPEDAGIFLTGQRRAVDMPDCALAAVMGRNPDAFLGVAHIRGSELIPQRLLSPQEISEYLQQSQTTMI